MLAHAELELQDLMHHECCVMNPSAAGTYSNALQATGTGTGLRSTELFSLHLQRTDRR